MCNTLRRLLSDVRPFEYVMLVLEALVLLLIAYEVGSGIWHRLRRHRRSKRVLKYLLQGQALKSSVPTQAAPLAEVNEWRSQVQEWTDSTNRMLKRYSSEASASFLPLPGFLLVQTFLVPFTETYTTCIDSYINVSTTYGA